MRSVLLTFALVVAAVPGTGSAETVLVPIPGKVVLGNPDDRSPVAPDLRISSVKLSATYGIRWRPGPPEFAHSAPLLIDESFEVRDATGALFRVRVLRGGGNHDYVALDISPADAPELTLPSPSARSAGVWRLSAWTLNGKITTSAFPDLNLSTDGRFRLGAARGRWMPVMAHTLTLDGHYASWGPGELSPDGEHLTFQFDRGAHRVTVTFSRVRANDAVAERPVQRNQAMP